MADKSLESETAKDDLGFLPAVFSTLFGAPAVVTLIQMAFETGSLAAPLQVVIDAYREGMAAFGAIVEPPMERFIATFVQFDPQLHEHWRHFLVLSAGLWLAQARIMATTMQRRDLTDRDLQPAALFVATRIARGAILVILASIAIGLVPPDQWWGQGLIAWLGASAALSASDAHITVQTFYGNKLGHVIHWRGELINFDELFNKLVFIGYFAPFSLAPLFLVGGGLWFIPGVGERAALIVVLAAISLLGLAVLAAGVKGKENWGDREINVNLIRFALTILGGFLGAALVFAASWAMSLS